MEYYRIAGGGKKIGLEWTGMDKWFISGLFLDLFLIVFFMIWEFRGKNLGKTWEKLGTFGISNQGVTNLFGNFVGITWE